MRLANTILRDVKPKLFNLYPRCSPPLWLSPPCLRRTLLPSKNATRRYASALSLKKSEDPLDLLLSGLYNDSPGAQKVPAQQPQSGASLIQDAKLFAKWKLLLTNPYRLSVESDFFRRGPAKEWHSQLLVDEFENRGDLALWSCLLDYQKRTNGDVGVHNVWRGLWGRKFLYDVQNPLAAVFWQTILEAAVRSNDEKFLPSVWIYSEWMYDVHQVKWPRLYLTMLSHFLRTHQHHQALKWHLRLVYNFYPGAEEFASLMKEFAPDRKLYEHFTLESLYITSPDHKLYDILIPYLYEMGESQLATKWRRICTRHDDLPQAHVPARPFLRFFQGYFPHQRLFPGESAAVSDSESESAENPEQVELSREFVNRVHGGTFGISVKNYNDGLGAKWLASSWIGLDIAISTISALGIQQIGPLSLQSIALREGTSEGVLRRIKQLREHGISVVDSNYYRLVLYLAKIRDDQLLLDLLKSDLHPVVFDDVQLLRRLAFSTAKSEEWRTHRLMLATSLIVMERSAREVANTVARVYILEKKQKGLLKVLTDMKNMKLPINLDLTNMLFDDFVNEAKSTYLPSSTLQFYLPVYRQLVSMEVPVPIRCWRKAVFSLTRQSRLDSLEELCIELVDLFTSSHSSRPGFVPVHPEDIPDPIQKPLSGVENLLGVYIPLDLPTETPQHPLRRIFDTKLLGTMVRYSFNSTVNRKSKQPIGMLARQRQSSEYSGARCVRLMRILHNRGMFIDKNHLATWVKLRLTILYGPGVPSNRTLQIVRGKNNMTLTEMKSIIDEAWGEELLPPIEELWAEIEKRSRRIMQYNPGYLQDVGQTTPQLRVVL
ncbi:uncharacterized protein GGS25DRAFT_279771 [Hypoxylon fragiforme]|uniref:uncharacterized protein n=1 Tax=Hypoxylon fragiforme TaxID=63214 RepID=UPI0020C648FC|nr:uncharacterized protein GGS25DRAFT_279771 [Hypoxylon fragiforme]KAI2608501.1 hypothetical protein GGS25DRAFT_279771 [Hypoxylon fragiforme]